MHLVRTAGSTRWIPGCGRAAGAAPTAISLDEFDRYFAPDGPAAVWERQALVKARPVIGSAAAVERVGRIIAAAAYERRWTAAEVEAIRQMRLRMEQGARPTNLKRGPGGVVDIEFIRSTPCEPRAPAASCSRPPSCRRRRR